MKSGKKTIAQKQVYRALEQVKKQTKKKPLEIFRRAVSNIKPSMEVRPRRVGGAAYQVPIPVRGDRREALAIRWLIQAAQSRSNKDFRRFSDKLAAEIVDASKNEGGAVAKKQQIQKLAEANKAFSHFRW
jgi:small subunit ribosomal protein S7